METASESLIDTLGNTPLVRLSRFHEKGNIMAKVESRNPLFCVKCRTAWGMIRLAEREGILSEGSSIVEPTSGNTGIGLAWIARIKGYKLYLTMPDTMSTERRRVVEFLGAEVILTPGDKGMRAAIDEAHHLQQEKGAYMPDQFSNPGNVEIHYETTGPEIWKQSGENVDAVVLGVGTGGTLTGVARYLKEKNPDLKVYAIEPADSPVLSGGKPGPHKIQGIGAGFIPGILDESLIDGVETVSNDDAIQGARELGLKEGLLGGLSSGAAVTAARNVAEANPDMNIVTLLPDTGERYISTILFNG